MSDETRAKFAAALALKNAGPTMTITAAGYVLGISRNTAYAAVKAGTFPVPVVRIGHSIRVPTQPLRDLLGIAAA